MIFHPLPEQHGFHMLRNTNEKLNNIHIQGIYFLPNINIWESQQSQMVKLYLHLILCHFQLSFWQVL